MAADESWKRAEEMFRRKQFIEARGWDEYYPWRFRHERHGIGFTLEEAYAAETRDRGTRHEQ